MTTNQVRRNVPKFINDKVLDEQGLFSATWYQYMTQQQQYIQNNLGDEGYKVPPISSDPASVTPSAAGGQVAQLEQAYADSLANKPGIEQNNAPLPGTVIFDPYEVNGGSSSARNGQLKVLLADGVFHAITNT